jgi:hypothetical protein
VRRGLAACAAPQRFKEPGDPTQKLMQQRATAGVAQASVHCEQVLRLAAWIRVTTARNPELLPGE